MGVAGRTDYAGAVFGPNDGYLYIAFGDGGSGRDPRNHAQTIVDDLWGSILLGDGKLYVSNLEGDVFVVRAGPDFKRLAKNSLGETIYAAPAISNGELFLRTHQHLYCISEK